MRAALIAACVLVGCNSDNFTWEFVSNPGGGDSFANGGAVLILRRASNSGLPLSDGTFRFLRESGSDERGAVTVYLAAGGDFAARQHRDRLEIRSPLLDGPVRLPAATLRERSGAAVFEVQVAEASLLHASGVGRGVLYVAEVGNLLVLEHQAGLVLWGTGAEAEVLPPDHRLDSSGAELRVLLPDQRLRVLKPGAPPPLDERVAFNDRRGSIRVFGPRRELLAELPRERVRLAGGAQGVFLSADFPQGVSARDARPLSLLMAAQNRYLLRIEG